MSQNNLNADMNARLEEAETLIWSLLDEQLDDAGSRRLATLLEEDPAVRARYVDCVQLHVDLREHFGQPPAQPGKSAIVLPNLIPGMPLEGFPQITE
jgi:hypothetical protein